MKTWLVLDVHYLCHRAFHSTQNLSFKDKPTGVIFGFLKSITALKDEFDTDRVVFCFESKRLLRSDVYPPYKRKRTATERTEEEQTAYEGLVLQISELRRRYLPKIGFKNIFSYRGYESDDVMAEIARSSECTEDRRNEEIILVTADNDMLQCLSSNVRMYSPQKRKLMTDVWFQKTYGINPSQWAMVKAIAGCPSDEVEGIKGVGELTALRYVRRELPSSSAAYKSIVSAEGKAIVRRNRSLVELPYRGCPTPDLVEDDVNRAGWRQVCGMLGMRSLAAHPPIATRKRK